MEKFLGNKYPKFHVMQVSRKYKGKLDQMSKYNPLEFFDNTNPDSLLISLRNLMSDS